MKPMRAPIRIAALAFVAALAACAPSARALTVTNLVADFGGKYGYGTATRRQTNTTAAQPGLFTVPYADGGVGLNTSADWGDLLFDPTFPNAIDPNYPVATKYMFGGYASVWVGSATANLAYSAVMNGNMIDSSTPCRYSARYRGSLGGAVTRTEVAAMLMFPKVGWLGKMTNRTVAVTGGDAVVSLYAMRNIYAAARLVVQDGSKYYYSRKISKDTSYTTDGGNNPVPRTEVIVLSMATNQVPDGVGGFSNVIVVASAATNEWPGTFANLPVVGWAEFDPHASMKVSDAVTYDSRTFGDVRSIGVLWNGGVHYSGSTNNVAAAQTPWLMLNDFEFVSLTGTGTLVLVR